MRERREGRGPGAAPGIRRLLGATLVAVLAGCSAGPELDAVADMARETFAEADLQPQFQATIGGWLLAPGSLVVYPFHREAGTYLSTVRRVDVKVFQLRDADGAQRTRFGTSLHRAMAARGLEPVIFVREPDETVGVFIRSGQEPLEEFFVVVLDGEDLVLLRIQCNFERLLAAVLAYRGPKIFQSG